MNLNKRWLVIGLLAALLLGSLIGGIFLGEETLDAFAAGEFVQLDDDDDGEVDDNDGEAEEDDQITGSVPVGPDTENPANLAEISTAEAEQAALAEYPDAQAEEVELEVENGFLVYEVELDNGMEIVVDAGNGDILHSEVDD